MELSSKLISTFKPRRSRMSSVVTSVLVTTMSDLYIPERARTSLVSVSFDSFEYVSNLSTSKSPGVRGHTEALVTVDVQAIRASDLILYAHYTWVQFVVLM